MSFTLTYSSMFDPPPQLHQRFEEALARVSAGLGARHPLYISGKDRAGSDVTRKFNPANQEQALGEFANCSMQDVDDAMRAAHDAWKSWQRTPASVRLQLLRRVGVLLEERVYDLAAALTLEVGKNRMEALAEAQESADFFKLYCDDFERSKEFAYALPNDPVTGYVSRNRVVLKPYGVWVVISPFNFPLALATGPVVAALVTGNTVVLKGSPATPWAGRLLADCIRDAGLPPGVFNYLGGAAHQVGSALIEHSLTAGITFTGSHDVGMKIANAVTTGRYTRPCISEMGGKNACIVTAAADLDRAAAGIVRSAFGMTGQKCSALSRLYMHRDIADALLERIVEKTSEISIGNPALKQHWLGPAATRAAYENYGRWSKQLEGEGARPLVRGQSWQTGELGRGFFVHPIVAEAPAQHPLWQTEMFLPILMCQRVATNDEAMTLANQTALGLTAGFYGAPGEVAWFQENIEVGVTYANRPQGATTGAWPGYQSFVGWKGSGNTGKAVGSFQYLPQYLREQSQTVVD